jgi:hypothetical protein
MPFNSEAWRQLQNRAAHQLSPQFADNVLREARLDAGATEKTGWLSSPLVVSAATATVCLLTLVLFHVQRIEATSARHLADWQEISAQTASLDPSP